MEMSGVREHSDEDTWCVRMEASSVRGYFDGDM